jgi:hypothetical protein
VSRIAEQRHRTVSPGGHGIAVDHRIFKGADLPPLKWSSLKYGLTVEDEINGEEEAYS